MCVSVCTVFLQENPAVMLENLRAIKAKHAALSSQVKEITAAQKESMDSIRNNLSTAMELVQHFQQTTDEQVPHCVLTLQCFISLSLCECHTVDDVLLLCGHASCRLACFAKAICEPADSCYTKLCESQMHLLNMRQHKIILQFASKKFQIVKPMQFNL